MKIVHAASEVYPFIKTGGLADAVGALGRTLAEAGHEVFVFLPGYRAALAHPKAEGARSVLNLRVEMGDHFYTGEIRELDVAPNLKIYFVCREEFFDRSNPYGTGTRDYEDNHYRFIFFCKAVAEAMRLLDLKADVVHGHDWQAGLLPLMVRFAEQTYGQTLAIKTVFTIHNIAFQGLFPMRSFSLTGLPDELMGIDGLEYYGQISMMKGGILFADRVTTVSPRYAEEIQTSEFGCGLDGVVATRSEDLVGLINGIEDQVWNPAIDPTLPANYSADDLQGKAACRAALLKKFGHKVSFKGPVFGMVCRVTEQKGVDLLLSNRSFFERENCKLIFLGKGDAALETRLKELSEALPDKVSISTELDEPMSHLIEAGSDFFVMPSRFEPCGLNQMYSLAYGTIPLVSQVGGLIDTVTDIDTHPEDGTGITFAATTHGLRSGLERALKLYSAKDQYAEVQVRGMKRDFSWKRAAFAYESLYEDTI